MTVQPTIEGFLAAARQALAGASPQQAMRALLDATVKALYARTGRWIEHDSDEMLLASSPDLTIYHIALSPRIHYPPHDHRVPAMIALYQGAETSSLIGVTGGHWCGGRGTTTQHPTWPLCRGRTQRLGRRSA